ncbi:DNA-deoxyinosine glycosylase [Sphingomonas sp.]|uniref:DNA-deoxyinosine glycosylase n=1 Tax=Sphingomonas sp. TaxID=28214 RepID=UPI00286D7EB6|nr:DNA-deoxyinosine glycosylase [Sphingomonas sp.]
MTVRAKACLPPVVDDDTRLLILGSLPGDASLAAERYYAHPQNQFWRLLGGVLGEPLAELDYAARLERLAARGVGLWDVVASAVRPGSLDGALRLVAANPLRDLVASLPELSAIAFNGGTAARIGRRELGAVAAALIDLPSSSPANTRPFAAKAEAWARLADFA